ncbi:hypothetical protein LWI28_016717 [Acer negundo]|uniref:Reverse transcriptase domain-containing protein n=1 Tax=Acer negundo TaxID=4023 RepID=A0AAD5JUX7_ACENE|nr:hypothetical protein LWI28_016717 [Acer negundo]
MINVLFWNYRGIRGEPMRRVLRELCRLHKPALVCIVEPMVDFSSISSGFLSSLGLRLVGMNDRGGLILTIWVFTCASFPEAQTVHCHDQHLTVSLSIGSRVHCYTFVYASTSIVVRRSLWQSLRDMGILIRWLRDGDRNTSFFHASIKRKQYRNTISALSINGVLSEDRPTIRDHIISYHSGLFSSDVPRVGRDLSIVDDVIPSLVTVVENAFLTSVSSADDIHDTVFVINAASAPRPDGFSGSFYQRCWDVVGSDVVLAVQDFFITRVIFLGLNSSFIVLLPKLRDSISVNQFRPIILSNFLFKIFSKILADRLAWVATRIISPQQFSFIRDRHIEDYIALASDCVNVLQKKCYGGNLAMKIDICKAFDTLDWSFLFRVLQAFGFSSDFRRHSSFI